MTRQDQAAPSLRRPKRERPRFREAVVSRVGGRATEPCDTALPTPYSLLPALTDHRPSTCPRPQPPRRRPIPHRNPVQSGKTRYVRTELACRSTLKTKK